MTAIDWIINELIPTICLQQKYIDEIKERAKQMEKQQIIDAHGLKSKPINQYESELITGEQYYNETFNKLKQ